MRISLISPAAMLALTFAAGVPAHAGLIITPTYDSTITGDANAADIETAIYSAINVYQALFSNNITVPIYFQAGGGLGQSNTFVYNRLYSSVYNGLVNNNANPAALASLRANGGLNPVTNDTTIEIKSANARALGINIAPGCQLAGNPGSIDCGGNSGPGYDGVISLNTNITFPPQANDGSNYQLFSVVLHEIDEVLGLGSAFDNCNPNGNNPTVACANGTLTAANDTAFGDPALEDLWRYLADGTTRTFSIDCNNPASAYLTFSASNRIAQFNNGCNGGDFSDWQSSPRPTGVAAQVQDAFSAPGNNITLGTSEINALTAIGYTLAANTPEPTTWMLMIAPLAFGVVAKKRRAPDMI